MKLLKEMKIKLKVDRGWYHTNEQSTNICQEGTERNKQKVTFLIWWHKKMFLVHNQEKFVSNFASSNICPIDSSAMRALDKGLSSNVEIFTNRRRILIQFNFVFELSPLLQFQTKWFCFNFALVSKGQHPIFYSSQMRFAFALW